MTFPFDIALTLSVFVLPVRWILPYVIVLAVV